ncbi:MAG: hypothetical protein ACQEVA_04730 [Myxococcota bacterium]
MSDDAQQPEQPERAPLREDPLSMALIGAAVLLAIVYVWDQRSRDTLQAQMSIAETIHANFKLDSGRCTVGSADANGRALVFACTGISASEVATAAANSDTVRASVDAFEEVLFRSPDGALSCPASPEGWPDSCEPLAGGELSTSMHLKKGARR